jgi:hypothetical protein
MINKSLAIIAITTIIASISMIVSFVGTSFADKVGPNGEREDVLKQGALGEFYSKAGKEFWFGGASGHEFGDVRSDIASSESGVIGANTAYYGSGECHSKQHSDVCI